MDSPFFMAPPTHLAYSPQLILHEPSFAEGVRYHHVFDVDEMMLRTLHEEVLRKVAGGEALTKQHPVYGLCLCFARNHPLDREDRWQVCLLSYWDCPGFDSNTSVHSLPQLHSLPLPGLPSAWLAASRMWEQLVS